MSNTNINSKKGFTIIEVILVLAIGSLIILMALVALPSLQASQRDSQRKTDYSMLETAITSYSSNNRGALPTTTDFIDDYIKDTWADPSAGSYNVTLKLDTTEYNTGIVTSDVANKAGDVVIYISSTCEGETPIYNSNLGSRRYAIYAFLESGHYCQAN